MAAIERSQENTIDKINWFTTLNNVLTDFFAVEYQLWDISAGLPGDVIFPNPGVPGDWEVVTTGAGHFGVGRYYAYDNTLGAGWTPGPAEPLGTHRILWRWKVTAGDAYQSSAEDFEVLSVGAGPGADLYISVQDIRDLGLDVADYPDAQVLAAITTWQALIDRACRQWFREIELLLTPDGNDSAVLFFGIPIIEIEYVKLNGQAAELDSSLYRVYNSRTYPDDRRNPRIKLKEPYEVRDIYTWPSVWGPMKFRKGRQNQEIKGTFGFVEENGEAPELIKRALKKLVVEKLTQPIYGSAPAGAVVSPLVGQLIAEKTDGHEMRWSPRGGQLEPRKPWLAGITQDQEIIDILTLYRAPIGIATPAHWSYAP